MSSVVASSFLAEFCFACSKLQRRRAKRVLSSATGRPDEVGGFGVLFVQRAWHCFVRSRKLRLVVSLFDVDADDGMG